jgi:hypothetical protein
MSILRRLYAYLNGTAQLGIGCTWQIHVICKLRWITVFICE